jgi:endogenous inhibitor of DNA gyrase (YacG/DUF329 family)
MTTEPRPCPICKRPVPEPKPGHAHRRSTYCSQACARAAWKKSVGITPRALGIWKHG